jgi:hypothetical protein
VTALVVAAAEDRRAGAALDLFGAQPGEVVANAMIFRRPHGGFPCPQLELRRGDLQPTIADEISLDLVVRQEQFDFPDGVVGGAGQEERFVHPAELE